MDRSKLKSKAKSQLKGNWGMLILACIILSVISGTGVLGLVILGPLQVGMAFYMFTFIRSGNSSMENLFVGFNKFSDNLVVGLVHYLYIFLWVGLPMMVVMTAFFLSFIFPMVGVSLAIAFIGMIPCGILAVVKTFSYSATFYIKLENPHMKATDCLAASNNLMKGHKWELFVLNLSFIGWGILAVLTFGIGFILLAPYQKLTEANYFLELLTDNDMLSKGNVAPEEDVPSSAFYNSGNINSQDWNETPKDEDRFNF